MTAQEKATEIFYKFNSFNTYGLDKQCCKKSALFLVDEIIEVCMDYEGMPFRYSINYWEEVKIEIEKI